ncbi:hypothetical protein B1H10_05980 [candidate division KSB1 bacterium 4484_188]|nr:MAG: hypothetical protein B1H10_05980 [candidate division KSB1 bacterium 4484_188]
MRYSIQKGNLKMNGLVEKLIQRKTDKIETLLTHYHPELIDLKIKINKLEDKGIFTVQMLLSLPSQVLRSEKESKDKKNQKTWLRRWAWLSTPSSAK